MKHIVHAEIASFPQQSLKSSNLLQSNVLQGGNVFNVFPNTTQLTIENKFFTLQLLQTSVDLKTLMNNYSSIVTKFVRPFNIHFQSAHGFFSNNVDPKYNVSKSYNLSLSSDRSRIGCITYQSDTAFPKFETSLFVQLHELLIPNLKHALKHSELNAMVFIDHLTNIGNRAYYEQIISKMVDQNSRNSQGLTLMLLDLNGFKNINDTYGHQKGDEVLQTFASILTKSVRTSDMAFRLGGDEFAIVLQPSHASSVEVVVKRLFNEIGKNKFLSELNFSTSIGCSDWSIGKTPSDLFNEADVKLYDNKNSNKF